MLIICGLLLFFLNILFATNIEKKITADLFDLKKTDFLTKVSTWDKVFAIAMIKKDMLGKNIMIALKEVNPKYYESAIKDGFDLSNISNYEFYHSGRVKDFERYIDMLDVVSISE